MKLIIVTLSAFIAVPAFGHPYYPVEPGTTAVYEYRFRLEGAPPALRAPAVNGKMIATAGARIVKNGHEVVPVTTEYRDIPYQAAPTTIWLREDAGALVMGSEMSGKYSETTILPADTAVGAEWDYDDGKPSKRRVVGKVSADIGDKRYPDCIEVSRRGTAGEYKNIYCAGIGEVRGEIRIPSPAGTSVVETELLELQPAAKH